jgi:hypothetical protein
MTLNAFDLAEWASLHPAQYATSPPLLAPLMFRLQLLILSVILGANAMERRWKAGASIMILVLTIAQFPPFEFLYDINNLNYRQQFFLASTSLIASFSLLAFNVRRISTLATVALPLIGIVAAAYGQAQAAALYHHFGLDAAPGAGVWLLSLSYIGMTAIALAYGLRKRR